MVTYFLQGFLSSPGFTSAARLALTEVMLLSKKQFESYCVLVQSNQVR